MTVKIEAREIDVKTAFLKEELENNKEVNMQAPKGFEKIYPKQDSWLQIKKPIYGQKHSGLYYYQPAKWAIEAKGTERSKANSCLSYTWRNEG